MSLADSRPSFPRLCAGLWRGGTNSYVSPWGWLGRSQEIQTAERSCPMAIRGHRPVAPPLLSLLVQAGVGRQWSLAQRVKEEFPGRPRERGLSKGRGSPQLASGWWRSNSFRNFVFNELGEPKRKTMFSGSYLGEDWRKKTRAQEGVRAPEPHGPMRADRPNSVSGWPDDPACLAWSWQPSWGEL